MTEYRLVPVEPTEEMIEAACTFETWGWGFTRELDREAAAATYAAMLSAAPPTPTREAIEAQLDKHIYAEAESEGVAWVGVRGIREAADAILSLLRSQS
jgi:hypothetical protein